MNKQRNKTHKTKLRVLSIITCILLFAGVFLILKLTDVSMGEKGTYEGSILQEDENYFYFCSAYKVSKIDKKSGEEIILWENMEDAAKWQEQYYTKGSGILVGERIYFMERGTKEDGMWETFLSQINTDGTGYQKIDELEDYVLNDYLLLKNGKLYVSASDVDYCYQVQADGSFVEMEKFEWGMSQKISFKNNGDRTLFRQEAIEEFGFYLQRSSEGVEMVDPVTQEAELIPGLKYFEGYNEAYIFGMTEDGMLKAIKRESLTGGNKFGDKIQEKILIPEKEDYELIGYDEENVYILKHLEEETSERYSFERISIKNGERKVLFDAEAWEFGDYSYGQSGRMDFIIRDGYLYYIGEQNYDFYRMRRNLENPSKTEIIGEVIYATGISEIGTLQRVYKKVFHPEDSEVILISYDLMYPVLDDRFAGADAINDCLEQHKNANLGLFDDMSVDDIMTRCSVSSNFDGISYFDGRYISFVQDEYVFYGGGAHGMPYKIGYIFDVNTGERLLLKDICSNTNEEINEIVTRYYAEMINGTNPDAVYFESDAIEHVRETAGLDMDVCLTKEGIQFWYEPYVLAGYAAGFQMVVIPYSEFEMSYNVNKYGAGK